MESNSTEIVSWITVNGYSKSIEFIFFYLAVLGIPVLYYLISKKSSIFNLKKASYQKAGQEFEQESLEQSQVKEVLFLAQVVVVPLVLYYFLFNPSLNGFLDLYHEGERLAPLQMSIEGGLPYKDIFIQHGVGRNLYLPKLASSIFGPSVRNVRLLFNFLEPVPYLLIYILGMLIFRGGIFSAILPVVICSGVHYWIGLRQGLCVSVVICFLCWLNSLEQGKRRERCLIVAGLLSAITFWFSLDYGLYSIFASLCFLMIMGILPREKRELNAEISSLLSYLGGLLLGFAPVFAYFLLVGIFPDFLLNTYQQLSYQLTTWGLPFAALDFSKGLYRLLISQEFRIYLSILVLIVCGCYLAHAYAKRMLFLNPQNLRILLLFIFSVVCFRTAMGRSDYGHWIDGSTFIWILFLLPFDYFIFGKGHFFAKRMFGVFAIILAIMGIERIHQPIKTAKRRVERRLPYRWLGPAPKLEIKRLGSIVVPEQQKRAISGVVNYIQENTKPGEHIYDFANQGAYYFLTNRPSPSRYYHVSYAVTSAMQREVISELETKKPKIVISSTGTVFDAIDGIPSKKRHKLVYEYLQEHYDFAVKIEETVLLKLKEPKAGSSESDSG